MVPIIAGSGYGLIRWMNGQRASDGMCPVKTYALKNSSNSSSSTIGARGEEADSPSRQITIQPSKILKSAGCRVARTSLESIATELFRIVLRITRGHQAIDQPRVRRGDKSGPSPQQQPQPSANTDEGHRDHPVPRGRGFPYLTPRSGVWTEHIVSRMPGVFQVKYHAPNLL